MKRYGVPRIAFINKMDRPGANPERIIEQLRLKLKTTPVVLHLSIGSGNDFEAVIDLIEMQVVRFDGQHGEVVVREAIPDELMSAANAARRTMLETLSMFDDDLMTSLLQDEEPISATIRSIIRAGTLALQLTPVLAGSA